MDNLNELENRTRAFSADIDRMRMKAERREIAALLADLQRTLDRLDGLIADLEKTRDSIEAPKIDRRIIREVIAPELDLHRARQGRM